MTSTTVAIGSGAGVVLVLVVLIARLGARLSRLEGIEEARRRNGGP